jgi:hypothetical protein
MSMRKTITSIAAIAALAGVAAFAFRSASVAQEIDTSPRAADAAPQPFAPQASALMSILIQPRHIKLWFAGKADNWPLAGHAFRDLQQGFAVLGRAVPRYKGLPVPDLVDAAMKQNFALMDFAIKAGDQRQFRETYDKITVACNACHASTENGYIVIKTPEANPFPDQEFEVKR